MKGAPGLIAVVLDRDTAEDLRSFALHDNVFCEHVTIAYRPTPEVYEKYKDLLGKEIEFDILADVYDDKGQAVVVYGVPSEKKVAHVTISCADGVKPSYSNLLLEHDTPLRVISSVKNIYPDGMRGRGIVKYVPL